MDAARSLSRNRKLFAAACIVAAAVLIGSLNPLLPMSLAYRHEIGCGLMIAALLFFLLGLAALFGRPIVEAVVVRVRPWSRTKRIVVGLTAYAVVGILCHLSVKLYDGPVRHAARRYLPENISWWLQ